MARPNRIPVVAGVRLHPVGGGGCFGPSMAEEARYDSFILYAER